MIDRDAHAFRLVTGSDGESHVREEQAIDRRTHRTTATGICFEETPAGGALDVARRAPSSVRAHAVRPARVHDPRRRGVRARSGRRAAGRGHDRRRPRVAHRRARSVAPRLRTWKTRRRLTDRPSLDAFPDDWSRALCVVAHPDDLEYGAAGRDRAAGPRPARRVTYLLVTRGEAGIDAMAPDGGGPGARGGRAGQRGGRRGRDGRVPRGPCRRRRSSTACRCVTTSRRRSGAVQPDLVVSMNHTRDVGRPVASTWPTIATSGSRRSTPRATPGTGGSSPARTLRGPACGGSAFGGSPTPTHFVDLGEAWSGASPACASTRPTSPASATTSTPTRSSAASPAPPAKRSVRVRGDVRGLRHVTLARGRLSPTSSDLRGASTGRAPRAPSQGLCVGRGRPRTPPR